MDLPQSACQDAYLECVDIRLFRLHRDALRGAQFNPGHGSSRFAPFQDDTGNIIPTIYAATTFDGAAYETVFRERPHKFQTIPRQKLEDRACSVIKATGKTLLARLFTPELSAWQLRQNEVFSDDESVYPFCRALARRIWQDNPHADGVCWSSVRDSGATAMMFFGDRITEMDFAVEDTRLVRENPSLLGDLRLTAKRAGITIAR